MVEKFEVGKTYRYTGEIGNYSPFTGMHIALDEAKIIVSGNPLVCTYSESEDSFNSTPSVGFKGMRHEHDGWAFQSKWHMFEEIEEVVSETVPYTERQAQWVKDNAIVHGSKVRLLRSYNSGDEGYLTEYPYEGTKVTKHPVGQVFRVSCVDPDEGVVLAPTYDDFEYNVGNYFPYFVLEKVADDTPVYGEPVAPPKASYRERQAEWVQQNKIEKGSKVRLVATAKGHDDGWMNSWVDEMSEHVGQIGTVIGGLTSTTGMCVAFGESMRSGFEYPYFVLEAVKETPTKSTKSVKEFEAGKWYVCHLTKRPADWNPSGKMDALLDGKPHKCIFGKRDSAEFEGMPQQGDGGWSFWRDLDYFEEVPAPTTNVEWEKKYTELKRKAIAMLSAYGEASKSFTEELEAL